VDGIQSFGYRPCGDTDGFVCGVQPLTELDAAAHATQATGSSGLGRQICFASVFRFCTIAARWNRLTSAESRAWNETAYPDPKGQWRPIGDPMQFDPSKARGPAQQAPLIFEYQAVFEANLKDQAAGREGLARTHSCISPGMPRVTNGCGPLEVIVTPRTTHIMVEHINDNRRIYTDGRDWPMELEPTSRIFHWQVGRARRQH
jgi:hypothetical protein